MGLCCSERLTSVDKGSNTAHFGCALTAQLVMHALDLHLAIQCLASDLKKKLRLYGCVLPHGRLWLQTRYDLKWLASATGQVSLTYTYEQPRTALWAAGELAAERQRSRAALKPSIAEPQSPHGGYSSPHRGYSSPRRGQIALCLSPSAAKVQQQTSAAAQSGAVEQIAAKSAAAFPAAATMSAVPQVCTVRRPAWFHHSSIALIETAVPLKAQQCLIRGKFLVHKSNPTHKETCTNGFFPLVTKM